MGKTTTAVNLGTGLATEEKKVLLIDGDPQMGIIGSLIVAIVGACICIWAGRKIFK